jgi:hypothetical protein
MLLKSFYFICFIISILQGLLYSANFIQLLQNPYKKSTEKWTFFVAALAMIIAVLYSYRHVIASGSFGIGIVIQVVAWVLILIWIMVMLLFFNGPINWQ